MSRLPRFGKGTAGMAASAALTDEQKMIAELFDNKLTSLGFSTLFAAQSAGLSLDEFVQAHIDGTAP